MNIQVVGKEQYFPIPSSTCVAELIPASAKNRAGYVRACIEVCRTRGKTYKIRTRNIFPTAGKNMASRQDKYIPNKKGVRSYHQALIEARRVITALQSKGWDISKQQFAGQRASLIQEGNVVRLPIGRAARPLGQMVSADVIQFEKLFY